MTRIKFCGFTRAEDVALAAQLGVDAVGFVFWPASPRAIRMEDAARLIAALPRGIEPVGLFVRPTRDEIGRAARIARIRVAQVYGVTDTSHLMSAACELWVATSLQQAASLHSTGATMLLDAHDPERHGGTGTTIDWDAAARIAATRRVMLAGGLTPGNVGEAIRRVRPYGVDVSSGIEERPGVKSAALMRAFVASVRNAEVRGT